MFQTKQRPTRRDNLTAANGSELIVIAVGRHSKNALMRALSMT